MKSKNKILGYIIMVFNLVKKICIIMLLIWKWLSHTLLLLLMISMLFVIYNYSHDKSMFKDVFSPFVLPCLLLWIVIYRIDIYVQILKFPKKYLGFLIYVFLKSKSIYKYNLLGKEELYFMLSPISGYNYFCLPDWKKRIQFGNNKFLVNLTGNSIKYLKGKKEMGTTFLESYTVNDGIVKLYFYRSSDSQENKVLSLNTNDVLRGLKLSVEKYILEITARNSYVFTISPKLDNNIYKIEDYIDFFKENTMYLGYTRDGEEISKKISFENSNSIAVYGKTGSGKTTFTRTLLYSLYLSNPKYRFYVIDPKGDMGHFKNIERVSYAHNTGDIINLLEKIQQQMSQTSSYFSENGLHNYNDYIKLEKKDPKFFPIFIFLEEYSLLLGNIKDKSEKQRVMEIVTNIAIGGRSIAFNLCFSLQVGLKSVIGSSQIPEMLESITFNISKTVGISIYNEKMSYNTQELGIGEGIIKQDHEYKKFKSYIVSRKSLEELVQKYYLESKTKSELYLEHARRINSFKKKEAILFGLTQVEFAKLSINLQEKGILRKASNNSLYFTDNNLD